MTARQNTGEACGGKAKTAPINPSGASQQSQSTLEERIH